MGKKKKGNGGSMEKKGDETEAKPVDEKVVGNKNEGGSGGGGGKKGDGPICVVLKVDMHCEGCTKKIRRSVKGFKGVEGVAADFDSGELTVVGTVDPWKLRDRVAVKTHKKVDLVSPANLPPPKDKDGKEPKKPDDKKPKEPAVTTVVLKIRLHCQGCVHRIRRTILKVKGAEHVSFDAEKDLVTVKGTMDAKRLPEVLKEKLKKCVEVVPPKKEDGGGEKKEKGGGGKKEGGKGEEGGGKAAAEEANRMDFDGGYHNWPAPAPQLFSDENPNGCSIM